MFLICCKMVFLKYISTNAEFAEEGTFFANRFPSLRTFVHKKSWNLKKLHPHRLKFIYSEKAKKICEIFTLLLTTVHTLMSYSQK